MPLSQENCKVDWAVTFDKQAGKGSGVLRNNFPQELAIFASYAHAQK